MKFDREGFGCAVAGLFLIFALVASTIFLGYMKGQNAAEDMARASLVAAETEQARVDNEHKETMFMLWTAFLDDTGSGIGLLDVIGAAGLVLLGGALGFWIGGLSEWLRHFQE